MLAWKFFLFAIQSRCEKGWERDVAVDFLRPPSPEKVAPEWVLHYLNKKKKTHQKFEFSPYFFVALEFFFNQFSPGSLVPSPDDRIRNTIVGCDIFVNFAPLSRQPRIPRVHPSCCRRKRRKSGLLKFIGNT